MELISQHTKSIMEGCKERARDAGLKFDNQTLEYIVTNQDLIELHPKVMIPTLYDYQVHDVEVLKEKGKYELYPHNPYETVINTRPAISFYNDNNPDQLNAMIFYHVLAHIDFFQNNTMFTATQDEDFAGCALSDKRTIARLRSEKGRQVDYVIEFTRGLDNLVCIFSVLSELNKSDKNKIITKLDFYFDIFLQNVQKVSTSEYLKELERYNLCVKQFGDLSESIFFDDIVKKYPEFNMLYEKEKEKDKEVVLDIIQYIQNHSSFLNKEKNVQMKIVMEIVRRTSIFFQPQIRTKIMNEGQASYQHEILFMNDDRIKGNEVNFAKINAGVTAMPKVGINPYALGMRLFSHIKDCYDKGKYSYKYDRISNKKDRDDFNTNANDGLEQIFRIREEFNDFLFVNTFIDQDFVDKYRLFVAGKRLNEWERVQEYYVKSRKAKDYKRMMVNSLYHPPKIFVENNVDDGILRLNHVFEGKSLIPEFILNTMLGIEFLWGNTVTLETSEQTTVPTENTGKYIYDDYDWYEYYDEPSDLEQRRVKYTMKDRKLERTLL